MSLDRLDLIELLEGRHIVVDAGCDLLNSDDVFVEDITGELEPSGSSVEFSADNEIRTTAKLRLRRQLDWGRMRLRPWIVVANGPATSRDPVTVDGEPVTHHGATVTFGEVARPGYLTQRWDLGVYLLETPQRALGENPTHFDVDCYDKTAMLNTPHGRTVHIAIGDNLLDVAAALIRPDVLQPISSFRVDTDTDGVADGWTLVSVGTPTATAQSLVFDLGRYFQRVTATTASSAVIRRLAPATTSYVIVPGHEQIWRMQTKGSRTATSLVRLVVTWKTAAGVDISTTSTLLPVETDWQETVFKAAPPPTAGRVAFTIEITSEAATTATTTLDLWKPSLIDATQDSRIYRDTVPGMKVSSVEQTWPVADATNTLEIVNWCLADAGCRPLFCDREGIYRMEALSDPSTTAPIWEFNWDNNSLVGEDRTETVDLFDVPNEWVFVRKVDPSEDEAPTVGAGFLTVSNDIDGPASKDARAGRVKRRVFSFDAADQQSFEAQASTEVLASRYPTHVIEISASPVPELWDQQVVTYADSGIPGDLELVTPLRMLVQRWRLPLDGSDMQVELTEVPSGTNVMSSPAVLSGGNTVTDFGGYRFHIFTASGTLTLTTAGAVDLLAVAGGASGGRMASGDGYSGGGGAGAVEWTSIAVDEDLTITVGAGGAAKTTTGKGNNGTATTVVGAVSTTTYLTALPGGGGGGSATSGSGNDGTGGAGIGGGGGGADQNNYGYFGVGGVGAVSSGATAGGSPSRSGGGGGAGGDAPAPTSVSYPGGPGVTTALYPGGATFGVGGSGRGSDGTGTSPAANTGNGSQGGTSGNSGTGGSGIFVARVRMA